MADDLLVVTGDQVDDDAEDVASFAAALTGLRARLGVFAVAGNHDVYAGWAHVHRGMSETGARVLVNEAVQLSHRDILSPSINVQKLSIHASTPAELSQLLTWPDGYG